MPFHRQPVMEKTYLESDILETLFPYANGPLTLPTLMRMSRADLGMLAFCLENMRRKIGPNNEPAPQGT